MSEESKTANLIGEDYWLSVKPIDSDYLERVGINSNDIKIGDVFALKLNKIIPSAEEPENSTKNTLLFQMYKIGSTNSQPEEAHDNVDDDGSLLAD